MIQAFATRMPRGSSWIWPAIVAVAMSPSTVPAQTPPVPGGDKTAPADDAKPAAKADDDPQPTAEVFMVPNAREALTVFNPLIFPGPPIRVNIAGTGDDRSKIQSMTARTLNIDADFLKRYVEYFAIELTKRDNLNAVLNPPQNQKPTDAPARGLERAVDALNKPIIDGKANNNPQFLTIYTRALFDSSLPKLLESNHNYLTRIDAMIVLGMAGGTTSNALDLYINQLKKPDQILWVKLWAARGLTNAAQSGKVDLDASKSNLGAEALVGLLEGDPKLPWPAQMRALEALGSLRVATANTPRGKVDAVSAAMRLLTDPEARPEARAWSAWALGMMKVPSSITPFNYELLGHEIGELAVDLGRLVVQEYDDDPANFGKQKDQAAHLTSLLLFQVYPSLVGEESVRDSGLLKSPHPTAASAKPFLTKLDVKVKAVALEAFELLRAGGADNQGRRNELDQKLADLKTFLSQTPPKDRHLVPGGPEFAPNPAQQVAGAAGR